MDRRLPSHLLPDNRPSPVNRGGGGQDDGDPEVFGDRPSRHGVCDEEVYPFERVLGLRQVDCVVREVVSSVIEVESGPGRVEVDPDLGPYLDLDSVPDPDCNPDSDPLSSERHQEVLGNQGGGSLRVLGVVLYRHRGYFDDSTVFSSSNILTRVTSMIPTVLSVVGDHLLHGRLHHAVGGTVRHITVGVICNHRVDLLPVIHSLVVSER